MLAHICAAAQLCKASNDQVPDLIELRITRNKEHITRNTIGQHLLARNAIVAKCKENPTHISLNLSVTNHSKWIEQVHDALVNQDIDWLFRQGKVDQCKRRELLDLKVSLLVHAQIHYDVDYAIADQLIE